MNTSFIEKEPAYFANPKSYEGDEDRFFLVDKDTIKLEVFPGKSKDQVSNFSSSVRTYHR